MLRFVDLEFAVYCVEFGGEHYIFLGAKSGVSQAEKSRFYQLDVHFPRLFNVDCHAQTCADGVEQRVGTRHQYGCLVVEVIFFEIAALDVGAVDVKTFHHLHLHVVRLKNQQFVVDRRIAHAANRESAHHRSHTATEFAGRARFAIVVLDKHDGMSAIHIHVDKVIGDAECHHHYKCNEIPIPTFAHGADVFSQIDAVVFFHIDCYVVLFVISFGCTFSSCRWQPCSYRPVRAALRSSVLMLLNGATICPKRSIVISPPA